MSEGKKIDVGSQSFLSSLFDRNVIKIDEFVIYDNIIKWKSTNKETKMDGRFIVQISSIAYLSGGMIKRMAFPIVALIMVIIGFVWGMAAYGQKTLQIWIIFLGLAWIIAWYLINKYNEDKRVLTIYTSAGVGLQILFHKEEFLMETMNFLEKLLKIGRTGNSVFTVNIKDCKIKNSKILDKAVMNNQ